MMTALRDYLDMVLSGFTLLAIPVSPVLILYCSYRWCLHRIDRHKSHAGTALLAILSVLIAALPLAGGIYSLHASAGSEDDFWFDLILSPIAFLGSAVFSGYLFIPLVFLVLYIDCELEERNVARLTKVFWITEGIAVLAGGFFAVSSLFDPYFSS